MIYDDREQAELECRMNERRHPGSKWVPKWVLVRNGFWWRPEQVARLSHDSVACRARRMMYVR